MVQIFMIMKQIQLNKLFKMRDLEVILNEVHTDCSKYFCQDWNSIALTAMKAALKEYKEDIIEQLETISNEYFVIDEEIVYGEVVVQRAEIDILIFEISSDI